MVSNSPNEEIGNIPVVEEEMTSIGEEMDPVEEEVVQEEEEEEVVVAEKTPEPEKKEVGTPEYVTQPDGRLVGQGCEIVNTCNGNIGCVDAGYEGGSNCMAFAGMECYKNPGLVCEKQDSGYCGWTETAELNACIQESKATFGQLRQVR